jgi:hypothetical protein
MKFSQTWGATCHKSMCVSIVYFAEICTWIFWQREIHHQILVWNMWCSCRAISWKPTLALYTHFWSQPPTHIQQELAMPALIGINGLNILNSKWKQVNIVSRVNMTRWCLSCLFFKKFRKVLKTRAMQDLPIPSWHKFLELVKHQAGDSSVFAGHITKCENLLGECTHRRDVLLSEMSCIVLFCPVLPSYSTGRSARYHKTNWKYKISCQWAWHEVNPLKQGFRTHASLRSTSGVLIFGMLRYPTANSKRNFRHM